MKNILLSISIGLAALLCAFLLWFYVVIGKDYENAIRIPIRLLNVPDHLTASNHFPDSAKVLVSGSGKQLFLLHFSNTELLINCENAKRGTVTYNLSGENVQLGGDIEASVLFVKAPSQISIHFDTIIKKELPVKSDIDVTLSENRVLISEPRLDPNRVDITGPRCNVALIKVLKTQHLEISNLSGDTNFFAFVMRPENYGIDVVPNKVRVKIEVEPIEKKQFKEIPVRLIDVPGEVNAKLNTATVSLVVAGAKRDVKLIKKEHINVFVKYSRFSVEQLEEVEPTVNIIGNVEWSNLSPPTIRLKKR